jgi:hypothetical protein
MDAKRQAKRDRAVLDHLTKGSIAPDKGDEQHTRIDEAKAKTVERAIQKHWSSNKSGGLPEF